MTYQGFCGGILRSEQISLGVKHSATVCSTILQQQESIIKAFFSQLNSDVFTGIMTIGWKQIVDEYRESKKVQGVTEASLYETGRLII